MIDRIIIEGCDRSGKSTVAELLKKYLSRRYNIKIIHFTGPPKGVTQKENFENEYKKIYNFLSKKDNNLIITDRDIYGEIVYGPTYRKEDPNWIWDFEAKDKVLVKKSLFVLLEDSAKNTLKRDDGKSFTINRFKRYLEILKFREALRKSIVPYKYKIKITNKTPEEVMSEIINYLYDVLILGV